MATTPPRFVRDDPATWTAGGMRHHLKTGTMNDNFYKEVFGWDDAQLHEEIKRANEALERAGIKPTEKLCQIRFEKDTQLWTQGALKRLGAGSDLITISLQTDRLFSLPHERNNWLRRALKFLQFSRDYAKGSLKYETDATPKVTASQAPSTGTPQAQDYANKLDTSPVRRHSKTPRTSILGDASSPGYTNELQYDDRPSGPGLRLDHADVHVAWLSKQDDNTFLLEKDFRSLRTWLQGPEPLTYNYKEIRKSLGMHRDPDLELFWFEDITGEPWVVTGDHAIAGAIERMHTKSKICFLLARDIEHVRALTHEQRDIEKQKAQTLTLDLSAAGVLDQRDRAYRDTNHRRTDDLGRRSVTPYRVPGISVSLARILGEQVMRSRVEFDG